MTGRAPRIYRTEAVVLKQRRLGEADRIITLYTPQLGKIDAVAKGIRKQTSRKAGHLEQLTLASLLLAHGQNLDVITQSETMESFLPVREDLQRLASALYVAELVDRFTELRSENYPVFRLLVETLQRLAVSDARELSVRYFELHLLAHLGYRPQLRQCVVCRGALEPVTNSFSAALGGVVCPECRHANIGLWRLSVPALKVLRLLDRNSFEDAERLRLSVDLMSEIETLLRGYVRHLLERNPRSLDFVEAVRHAGASAPVRPAALSEESAEVLSPVVPG